jgi:hypothetical protein
MPEESINVAAVLSIMPGSERGWLTVRLRTADQSVLTLQMPATILAALTIGLLSQSPDATAGESMMELSSAEVFQAGNDQLVLVLVLEKGLIRVPLKVPAGVLPGLRALFDGLDRFA